MPSKSDVQNAFNRNGEEGDREVTKGQDLLQNDEYGPPVHPCANTKVNHTVITPEGEKVLCLVPSEDELMEDLKTIGGFNRRYVAVNKEQAAKNFENPLDPIASNPKPIEWSNIVSGKRRRSIDENDDNFGDEERSHGRAKRAVKLGLQECEKKGMPSKPVQFLQFCEECWWITELSENKFPRLINERICGKVGDGDRSNVFGGGVPQSCGERYEGMPLSMCVQRRFTQDLLIRTDDYERIPSPDPQYSVVYKQAWKTYTQDIRSCCQCQIVP